MTERRNVGRADRRTGGRAVLLLMIASAVTPLRLHALLQGDMHPRETADRYEAVLVRDSLNPEANWRAAIALVDIGKQTPDNQKSRTRDSLYRVAEQYARRAARVAPDSADAHFALALALGKVSLTLSAKQRIRLAKEIRAEALRAIEIDSTHDGAWHVLGRWNAEVERLSNLEEFFAKTVLGGKVLGQASWDEALRCMRKAVQFRPDYIYHHLDLAEMLIERKRREEARPELRRILQLPPRDAMDPQYRARAEALLKRIDD